MTHGYFISMGGFHLFEGSTPLYPLDREFVLQLIHGGAIELPIEKEIRDKSKTNRLTSTLVFIQTLWFVANCLARGAGSLPVTKLEVVTIAYVAIYVWIYIILRDRPHYVDRPIPLQKEMVGTPVRRDQGQEKDLPIYVPLLQLAENGDEFVELSDMKRVPITYSGKPYIYRDGYISGTAGRIVLSVAISGAIHCISWSSNTNTNTTSFAEIVLWRLFSLAFFGLFIGPLTAFVAVFVIDEITRWFERRCSEARPPPLPFAFHVLVLLSFALYSIARIGLVVLAIMDLRAVPHKAYEEVYWTTFIPHF